MFCALAGVLWYSQFFGLEMGKSFLTDSPVLLAFSWSILMSLNVTFSNVWGILLKEWKGVSNTTIAVLILGLVVLISSIIVVAGTSVIVYIATSYELQVPFGMIAAALVACSS